MKQLLYFTASWCGPCRQLGPVMNEVANEVPVRKVDIDNEPTLAQQYGVRSVPTIVLVEKGNEKERLVGVQPKSSYIQMYNR
jgi:thioredoxin 1